MKHHLLPQSGSYYKAAMHTHSTVSDGKFPPEEVKRLYMGKGYSIVAFTDHDTLVPHNDLSDENFLALTSFEAAVSEKREGPSGSRRCCHLNIYAKDPNTTLGDIFPPRNDEEESCYQSLRSYETDAVNDLIARANASGCLVCYNHPVWSQENYPDYIRLKGLWGLEVYNYSCVVCGWRETPQPFYDFLRKNDLVFPVASDDSHSEKDYGGGFLMVHANSLTYENVFESLKNGDFYASSGPEIYEFSIDGTKVHVSTSEAVSITVQSERRAVSHKWSADGSPITEADFDISKYIENTKSATVFPWEPFIRLEVVDKYGNAAYTRAYRFDEIVKDAE